MQILNQRDDRWKNKKLGWSNVTIGGYGCLITCLAMQADLLPDDVNERLKDVVGYANLNLVVWDKIKEAIPWLEFGWRGWEYDNEKVKEVIEKYGSCIVEVDFDGTPRTDDSHFVLFVGNGKMYDPWTGMKEPTGKYPVIKGFVVIKTKGNTTPTDKIYTEAEMTIVREQRDEYYNEIKKLKTEIEGKNTEIGALKTKYADFIQWLSIKLACKGNEENIKNKIVSWVEVEDQRDEALKKAQDLQNLLEKANNTLVVKQEDLNTAVEAKKTAGISLGEEQKAHKTDSDALKIAKEQLEQLQTKQLLVFSFLNYLVYRKVGW